MFEQINFNLLTLTNFKEVLLDPLNIFLFVANILVYFFASSIIKYLFNGEDEKSSLKGRIVFFRFFSLVLLVLHIVEIFIQTLQATEIFNDVFMKTFYSIVVLYGSLFLFHVVSLQILNYFGKSKEKNGTKVKAETYKTRTFNMIAIIFFFFLALVSIVNIWDVQSVLGTTGIIGIFIGFIALTSGIWGQDIYNGIILLHSKLISDNNIIKFDDTYYIVYKTTAFETILFDIMTNSRVVIRNKELGNKTIENISKIAHTQGTRVSIEYKVGYGVDNSLDRDQRVKQWSDYKQNIINCFNRTIEDVSLKPDLLINLNHKPELLLTETADFALHYTVSFYLQNIDKSMNTETARNYIRTKEKWNELFLDNCVEYGVDLSTPILYSKV